MTNEWFMPPPGNEPESSIALFRERDFSLHGFAAPVSRQRAAEPYDPTPEEESMKRAKLLQLSGVMMMMAGAPALAAPPTGVEMMGSVDGNGVILEIELDQPRPAPSGFGPVTNLSQSTGIPFATDGITFMQDNNENVQAIVWNAQIRQIRHSVRDVFGNWSAWGDVVAATGSNPGPVKKMAICTSNGVMNVLALNYSGQLFHAVRFDSDRTWSRWGDVQGAAGFRGFAVDVACATNSGTGMQVGMITSDGRIWHSIRDAATGVWTPFGDVNAAAAGGVSGASKIGMTQDGDGNMQLMVYASGQIIRHTIRFQANGTWQPWGDVVAATGGGPRLDQIPESISGTAGRFGEVEWVFTDWFGHPWWTTRNVDRTWTGFQNLQGVLGLANFVNFQVSFYASPF
jgi:hypothetical protein